MCMDGPPRLLTWNYTPEEHAQLEQFLEEVGAPPAVAIHPQQGHLLIKDILKGEKHADQAFDCKEKVTLFYNIPNKGISFLIDQARTRRLPQPIYAAVTEHSLHWSFSELVQELIQEREAFRRTQQP